MKTKYWVISLLILALLGAGAYFLFRKKAETAFEWKTSKVELGDLKVTVTASGTVNADTTVQVGTQVSGIISKIFVDFNSNVRKGQVIAILDTTALAASVEEASANLFRNQVTLNQQKRNFERTKLLFDEKVVAQADYDQALSDYETAQANFRSAKSTYNRALINLRYATIVAPVSGVVVSRAVDVGQTVAASFSTPTLFAIANDLTKMQVQASIDEADIGKIKVDQEVTFTVDAYDDQVFEGSVRQIRLQPTTTQNVVKYTVIINAPNPDLKLMPGMTANITVKIQEAKDILKVPASALRFTPSQEFLDKNLTKYPDSVQKFITRILEFRKRMTQGGSSGGFGGSAPQGMQGGGQPPAGMMGSGAPGRGGFGGQRMGRGTRGMLWVKRGELPYPIRVRTGVTDGSTTEVTGDIKEGDEVITALTTTDPSKSTSQQQQNPFAPQMQRPGGSSSRGGR